MRKEELQSLRKILFLDASEAAKYVGKASTRAWQHWEKGDRPIPQDVIDKMLEMNEIQSVALDIAFKDKSYAYDYYDYDSFTNRFRKNKLCWRLYQSVLARVYQAHSRIKLLLSDAPEDCALYHFFENLDDL